MLSIYDYQKPEDFLKDAWDSKRKKNPQFTVRAWANQLDFKFHNPLHEMIKGKRKVPKSAIPKFIRSLGLNSHEGLYLEAMVDLSRAKTSDEKELYLERMKTLSPIKTVKFTELESFRLLQNPLHFFLSELAAQKEFKNDLKWIQEKLHNHFHLTEIAEAIERLITLDILREDAEGKILRVDQFIQSKSDISDKALKEYHKNLMKFATEAVDSQDVLEREFQAMALNIDTDRLPEAKNAIREFINNFTTQFDTPKAPKEKVYQLNMQFFKVTK